MISIHGISNVFGTFPWKQNLLFTLGFNACKTNYFTLTFVFNPILNSKNTRYVGLTFNFNKLISRVIQLSRDRTQSRFQMTLIIDLVACFWLCGIWPTFGPKKNLFFHKTVQFLHVGKLYTLVAPGLHGESAWFFFETVGNLGRNSIKFFWILNIDFKESYLETIRNGMAWNQEPSKMIQILKNTTEEDPRGWSCRRNFLTWRELIENLEQNFGFWNRRSDHWSLDYKCMLYPLKRFKCTSTIITLHIISLHSFLRGKYLHHDYFLL